MLRKRVLSALVLLPITIGFLALGGRWFFALIGALLSLAAWEWVHLLGDGHRKLFFPITLALVWLFLVDLIVPTWNILSPGLAFLLLASLVRSMRRFANGSSDPTGDWAVSVLGGLYLGVLGANFIRLRTSADGFLWCLLACGITWLADTAAYFVGSAWGRHKMAPKLSPGKTWEGIVGALMAGPFSGWILAALFGLGALRGVWLGLLIAALSPIGDLGISMIKRQVGKKDSGNLIPGHGGILDRIDSLLVSVTIAAYFVMWIG